MEWKEEEKMIREENKIKKSDREGQITVWSGELWEADINIYWWMCGPYRVIRLVPAWPMFCKYFFFNSKDKISSPFHTKQANRAWYFFFLFPSFTLAFPLSLFSLSSFQLQWFSRCFSPYKSNIAIMTNVLEITATTSINASFLPASLSYFHNRIFIIIIA